MRVGADFGQASDFEATGASGGGCGFLLGFQVCKILPFATQSSMSRG